MYTKTKVTVTKHFPDGHGGITHEEVKVHHTPDIRRIVRKYEHDYDCTAHKSLNNYVLRPNVDALWRLVISFY